MEPAARSTVDAQKVARIGLEVVTVLKVNVEVVNVLALLQTGNAIQMFVGIVGSAVAMALLVYLAKEVIIMNAGI